MAMIKIITILIFLWPWEYSRHVSHYRHNIPIIRTDPIDCNAIRDAISELKGSPDKGAYDRSIRLLSKERRILVDKCIKEDKR